MGSNWTEDRTRHLHEGEVLVATKHIKNIKKHLALGDATFKYYEQAQYLC